MTDPTPNHPGRFRYPARTRLVVAVGLALAIGGFVVAGMSASTDEGGDATVSGTAAAVTAETIAPGVEERIPPAGAKILGQETIGIDLAPSWTGELLLLPGKGAAEGSAVRLPDDEVEVTALNQLLYVPGPGKTIERLSGDYCLAATIWDRVEGRDATQRVENWCFSAT